MKRLTAVIITAALLTACTQAPTADPVNTPPTETTTTSAAAITTKATTAETTPVTTTTVTAAEAATATTPPLTETTTVTTTELPFEDTARNAYERLSLSFMQSDGNEAAPNDYAGAYAYGGTLFVCTTSRSPGEYYTSLLSGYTCVKYKTVRHSLNELTDICARAKELLDPDFSVAEVYVDVPSNKAAVTIRNGDYVSARTFLMNTPDLGFTLDMIEVSMADPEE